MGKTGWLIQAISGLLLVVLLGMHWVAQHYIAVGGLRTYVEVVGYLRHPLVFILEAAFLIVVTVHALFGVRAILIDLGVGRRVNQLVNWGLVFVGVFTIWYGLDLLRAITASR
jgi:succinate dehydrogenase / fumarate reductase membrane anchor subunit